MSRAKIYDKHRWKAPDTGKKTKELGGGILSLVKEELNGEELWNSIKNEIVGMADQVLCYQAKTKKWRWVEGVPATELETVAG